MVRRAGARVFRRGAVSMLVLLAVLVAGCTFGRGDGGSPATTGPDGPPRGGVARVGVFFRPEPDQPTLGGDAVRQLLLPQLFTATPAGTWEPSLVSPGSDVTASDNLSATFRLREGGVWSDGAPITADDLRRDFDKRAVAGVDGPDADGTITVRFTSPLPGWRRLWSFDSAVAAPVVGVWGGPFRLESMTPGLETVLKRNDKWWGSGPYLDELRLVVVPDTTTSLQLLEDGKLDVVMPPAYLGRTAGLRAMDNVEVGVATRTGWWFGLHTDPAAIDLVARRALQSSVLRAGFVDATLRDEATRLDGLAGPEDAVWAADTGEGQVLAAGRASIAVITREEEPMVGLLNKSMSKRAATAGWRTELLIADTSRAERWFDERQYQGALFSLVEPPEMCWRCRWGWFDDGLATAADAGDGDAVRRLEERLRDQAVVLPLWRPKAVVAWRSGLQGVKANGYGLSAAWNAQEWWRVG